MSLSDIPKALRARVFVRDGAQCQYCHLLQIGQAAVFHVNHVIPRRSNGATEELNLVLQCPHCSLRKSDKTTVKDLISGQAVPLFHPLRQHWREHFSLDSDGMLRGLTAVGRATVEALEMNDPLPRIARDIQIRLGLLRPSTHVTST